MNSINYWHDGLNDSSSEAEEYAEILIQTDDGLKEMINICKAYGLT